MILLRLLSILLAVLTIGGMGYYVAALLAALRFRRLSRQPQSAFAPPVSILKSLKGLDPGMMEAFRSHCVQSYSGQFELLFGVASMDDPAVAAVHALQAEFPALAIGLHECPERLGTNGKISTLIQLAKHARHEHLLINDSDITVSPTYLERVMNCFAPLEGEKPVGLVSALYRGRAHGSLASYFESLGISTDFQAGVILSNWLEGGLHYGLGSTLAVTRQSLAAIGGLEALVNQLADDYEMGARIDKCGFRLLLSPEVVETSIPAYNWRGYFEHQLRWARTVRDARPGGYFGLIFTYGSAWATLLMLVAGFASWSVALWVAAFLLRMMVAYLVGLGVLGDQQIRRARWLLPMRDLAMLSIWLMGFCGNTIVWRGHRFRLSKGTLKALD